jgi:hypothetical protein
MNAVRTSYLALAVARTFSLADWFMTLRFRCSGYRPELRILVAKLRILAASHSLPPYLQVTSWLVTASKPRLVWFHLVTPYCTCNKNISIWQCCSMATVIRVKCRQTSQCAEFIINFSVFFPITFVSRHLLEGTRNWSISISWGKIWELFSV